MALFEVRNLLKVYSKKAVLNIESLLIDDGIITAIVGPNGSGKTTLFEMLLDLTKSTSGEVLYDGERVNGVLSVLAKLRRETAYVMQNPFLFNYTVAGNIEYGLKLRKVPRAKRHRLSVEYMEKLGLSHLAARRRSELSGGERQRVAVARAFVLEPRVLLMDEHIANVDKENIHLINDLIVDINREKGTSIILTAHHPSQVEGLASRVIALEGGKIEDDIRIDA